MRRWVVITLMLGLSAYLATGLAVIQQDEVGVVRRFGAVQAEPWEPGLHWGLPWGLDRLDRVKAGQTRTLTVGARDAQAAPLSNAPNPEGDDFLTGDLNLVSAQVIVQYRVSDSVKYLFASQDVDKALVAAAELALTRGLSGRTIDDVLTTGRAEVADGMLHALQARADLLGLGVSIRAVRLGRVAPPVPVAPAFADASRARSDLRQVVTKAEEYAEQAAADSRGQSREIADRAAARHERSVQLAKGEADRFSKVLKESRRDLAATRRRLYLEALAVLLPRFSRKVVVAPGQEVDVGLLSDENTETSADSNKVESTQGGRP
ncbi:protease modulator HflK [Singulisphaera sp. PoT]|uniref:protease modulator HflK n=1 Tax=Singulisphaera sp. PoT TaxID=3411797 RepID=UPI003BF5E455